MRVYRETMPGTTDCVHCVRTWFPSNRDENKGRLGWSCELDEYDERIGCKKGQCHYYRKERKTK